jgi:hypothetical protein
MRVLLGKRAKIKCSIKKIFQKYSYLVHDEWFIFLIIFSPNIRKLCPPSEITNADEKCDPDAEKSLCRNVSESEIYYE